MFSGACEMGPQSWQIQRCQEFRREEFRTRKAFSHRTRTILQFDLTNEPGGNQGPPQAFHVPTEESRMPRPAQRWQIHTAASSMVAKIMSCLKLLHTWQAAAKLSD
jgi:hypothetical protein